MIKKTGRAVIFTENKDEIISIKRTKYNENGEVIKEYYTLPGGHLEEGESFETATIREIYEELGIDVKIQELLLEMYNEDLKQEEKFYICSHISGKIGTGTGEEWQNSDYIKYGKYELTTLKIKDLDKYNLLPLNVRDEIIKKYKDI